MVANTLNLIRGKPAVLPGKIPAPNSAPNPAMLQIWSDGARYFNLSPAEQGDIDALAKLSGEIVKKRRQVKFIIGKLREEAAAIVARNGGQSNQQSGFLELVAREATKLLRSVPKQQKSEIHKKHNRGAENNNGRTSFKDLVRRSWGRLPGDHYAAVLLDLRADVADVTVAKGDFICHELDSKQNLLKIFGKLPRNKFFRNKGALKIEAACTPVVLGPTARGNLGSQQNTVNYRLG